MISIPDPATMVELDDGWYLAWCVEASGLAWPWLVSPHRDQPMGCQQPCCAPHEHLPWPADPRLYRPHSPRQPRCGQPTAAGRPCRRRVTAGGPCWQHAADPSARGAR